MHARRWNCLLGRMVRLVTALVIAAAALARMPAADPALAAVPSGQASPSLPAGITLEILGSHDISLDDDVFDLVLERVPLDPRQTLDGRDPDESGGGRGSATTPAQLAGAHVLYVEAGAVVVASASGERTVREGESTFEPPLPEGDRMVDDSGAPLASYELRNESGACASVLRLSLWVLPGQLGGVPAAPSGPQRGCGSYEVLFHDLARYPWPDPATDVEQVQLFLARLDWTAEAWLSFTPLVYDGPVGLVVESGEFTIGLGTPDTGARMSIPRGGSARIDAGVAFMGEWAQPGTRVLVLGVAPAGIGWSPVPPRTTSDGGGVGGAAFLPGTAVRVSDDRVRLRASPSTSGDIVAVLARGTLLTVTGASESRDGFEWYPVVDESGRAGYVAGDFLEDSAA